MWWRWEAPWRLWCPRTRETASTHCRPRCPCSARYSARCQVECWPFSRPPPRPFDIRQPTSCHTHSGGQTQGVWCWSTKVRPSSTHLSNCSGLDVYGAASSSRVAICKQVTAASCEAASGCSSSWRYLLTSLSQHYGCLRVRGRCVRSIKFGLMGWGVWMW